MNIFYFDVSWKSADVHGHGYDVVPVGKAENDLGQNNLTTESVPLWVDMEKTDLFLAPKSSVHFCQACMRGVTSVFLLLSSSSSSCTHCGTGKR